MAHLLQIIISVLTIGIISEVKCEAKHYIHKLESTYTSDSNTPVKVRLNCSETEMQGVPVYWTEPTSTERKNRPARNDTQLETIIRGPPDAGNFTCCNRATDELLSHHTVLLVKKTSEGEIAEPMLTRFEEHNGTYLKCMANSYSGNFMCSWKVAHHDPDLKFTVRNENDDHTSGSIICDEPVRNSAGDNSEIYTVSCRKENSCPSAEEYQPITIILEVLHLYVYEEHILSFFIKDIIKPDASECQIAKNGDRTQLSWTHPKTWSTPESYFGLTYQIETVRYSNSGRQISSSICEVDNTTLLRNGSTLNCFIQTARNERFRVRSRDRYNKNDSAWSSWSEPCRGGSQRNDKLHNNNQEGETKVEPCKCQKN